MRGMVAPRTGAWIETVQALVKAGIVQVAPRTGAWIETIYAVWESTNPRVAPRTGAWIETFSLLNAAKKSVSPPARGRGLKRKNNPRLMLDITSRPPHGGVD